MSVDDPHDAFHPVIRDGVWWCEKHNQDAETCDCGRGQGSEALPIVLLGAAVAIVLIVGGFWIL